MKRKGSRKCAEVLGIAVLLLLAGGLVWAGIQNVFTVNIEITGEPEIRLEYGSSYEDPGACATVSGTTFYRIPRKIPVQVNNTVDTSALGDYQVEYSAKFGNTEKKEVRTVHIADTLAPKITLTQEAGFFTFPGQKYQEEGYTAWDNHDGDLTDRVLREENEGTVTYTVSDSSGNTASVTRSIVYDDPVPPELTLHDGGFITALYNKPFVDPGVTATDNCDGDISAKVAVEGTVDTHKEGTYQLVYTVSDSYENTVSAVRQVTVEKPHSGLPPIPENPKGGTVYLTFDDGPGPYTEELLDVLAKYNVKATFFMVDTDYISKAQRIAEEGHTVACHTASHRYSKVYANEKAFFDDLYSIQSTIEQYTGQKPMLLRFPGGSSNTVSRAYNKGIMTRLSAAVQEKGFHYFDWNVDSMDAGGAKNSNEVYRNVISGISKHDASVVLQHDIHKFSVEAVERIIQWGQANGYTFLPLTADSPGCHHGINN